PRGLRSVVEHVAEVAAAAAAMHLGAQHQQRAIVRGADGILQRLVEARPAGAAVELGLGGEQRQGTARAGGEALGLLAVERARMRPLSAVLAQHLVLHWREELLPLVIGLGDFECLLAVLAVGPAQAREDREAGRTSEQISTIHHGILQFLISWCYSR